MAQTVTLTDDHGSDTIYYAERSELATVKQVTGAMVG
jgi:hypothetical protein